MQQRERNQIYGMDCKSCYNENNLYVCYVDWNHHVIFFKDKVSNVQVVVLQLDQMVALHNQHEVQVMMFVVWMQYQSNLY